MTTPKIEDVARVCHEANRAWCIANGDFSQDPWDDAAQWQRDSIIAGVRFHIDNPHADASASHEAWLAHKIKDGWHWGEVKNANAKTHPCIVPFDQLPYVQQAKDRVVQSIVHAFFPAE